MASPALTQNKERLNTLQKEHDLASDTLFIKLTSMMAHSPDFFESVPFDKETRSNASASRTALASRILHRQPTRQELFAAAKHLYSSTKTLLQEYPDAKNEQWNADSSYRYTVYLLKETSIVLSTPAGLAQDERDVRGSRHHLIATWATLIEKTAFPEGPSRGPAIKAVEPLHVWIFRAAGRRIRSLLRR